MLYKRYKIVSYLTHAGDDIKNVNEHNDSRNIRVDNHVFIAINYLFMIYISL